MDEFFFEDVELKFESFVIAFQGEQLILCGDEDLLETVVGRSIS
jgi:hypothetical protein